MQVTNIAISILGFITAIRLDIIIDKIRGKGNIEVTTLSASCPAMLKEIHTQTPGFLVYWQYCWTVQELDSMIVMVSFQLGISNDFNRSRLGSPATPPSQLQSWQIINHVYQQPNSGQLEFINEKKEKKATIFNSVFHSMPSRALRGCQHEGGHPACACSARCSDTAPQKGLSPGSVVSLHCIVRGKARLGGFLVILLGEAKLSCSVSAAPVQEVGCLQCVLDLCYRM